jgi:N-acetyl-gamma-glutamyl-phosphate reductase
VGASGYSGGELAAILAGHRGVEIAGLYSGPGGAASPLGSVHPRLAGRTGPGVLPFDRDAALDRRPDAVFLATPHEASAALAKDFLAAGVRVIDLSGAFRLQDTADYPHWYGFAHPAPELLPGAVYGLTEWCSADALSQARLVANPGCYATSVLLALKPLAGLLAADRPIVCDAKSGVSGAGRKSDVAWSFAELAGNFKAYGAGTHRHEPEIRAALGLSPDAELTFVAHLLPVVRGILTTLHVSFARPISAEALHDALSAPYRGSRIVSVRAPGELPELRHVVGTPRAEIGFALLPGARRAVIVCVLDNLLKGAASQAVQNLNRALGYEDTEGLS